jgi:GxxExxY protein
VNDATPKRIAKPIPFEIEKFSKPILDSAYAVHSGLGPGLLESIYELAIVHELEKRGIKVRRQILLPVAYDGVILEAGLKLDLLVEDCIIVELKAVEALLPIHEAQLLSYLKLADKRLGFLINFHVLSMKDGINRLVL